MGGRILVVDDDSLLRSTVATVLEDEGYAVDHADDGTSALAQISKHQPDAILLDVLMPNMSGPELLKRLQQDAGTSKIPILMMTALHGIEMHSRPDPDFFELIPKPFDLNELVDKVALAVFRTQVMQPAPQAMA